MTECDLSRDRTWAGQYYCHTHCVSFRSIEEAEACPAGISFSRGRRAGLEEAAEVAESYEPHCESCPRGVAAAIRALTGGCGRRFDDGAICNGADPICGSCADAKEQP